MVAQSQGGEEIVAKIPAVGKGYIILGVSVLELPPENKFLKSEVGEIHGKCLKETREERLKT